MGLLGDFSLLTILLILGPVVIVGALIVYVVYRISKDVEENEDKDKATGHQRSANPSDDATEIVPTTFDRQVQKHSPEWAFGEKDNGSVEFDVIKPSGLMVVLSTDYEQPKAGYAVILDERGSGDDNLSDIGTSVSYISRLPQINGPASANALARATRLANKPTHVRITYKHGDLRAYVNGEPLVDMFDPFPTTGLKYVSFGHLGVQSGAGLVQNIRVQ